MGAHDTSWVTPAIPIIPSASAIDNGGAALVCLLNNVCTKCCEDWKLSVYGVLAYRSSCFVAGVCCLIHVANLSTLFSRRRLGLEEPGAVAGAVAWSLHVCIVH